jgi:hypothetical protein
VPRLNEENDLRLATTILATFGLTVSRFSKVEARSGKTPDFRVFFEDQLFAYCEVKSLNDEWLAQQAAAAARAGSAGPYGGCRREPVYNRVANQIYKAIKQLDAVNADRAVPNIIVLINYDAIADRDDLEIVMTGCAQTDGGPLPIFRQISEGRLGTSKERADLCLWIEAESEELRYMFFGCSDLAHFQRLCSIFRVDPSLLVR